MNKFFKGISIAVLALSMLACGFSVGSTPAAKPTSPPVENTSAPVATQASAEPAATQVATEAAPEYSTFNSPDGLFSMDVPGAWTSTTDTSTPNLTSYLYYPAEKGAAIQYIVYNDGTTSVNQKIAGKIALQLLNTSYTNGAGDIKISDDQPISDGSEQLTWTSTDGGYSGVTVFKGTGTTLTLITFAYLDSQADQYKDILDHSRNTLVFNQ